MAFPPITLVLLHCMSVKLDLYEGHEVHQAGKTYFVNLCTHLTSEASIPYFKQEVAETHPSGVNSEIKNTQHTTSQRDMSSHTQPSCHLDSSMASHLVETLEEVVQVGPFVNANVGELLSDFLFEVLTSVCV